MACCVSFVSPLLFSSTGAFFFSHVSAMGMFYLGSVFAIYHGVGQILAPTLSVDHSLLTASVLGFSFVVDSYVLARAVSDVKKEKPANVSLFQFLKTHNDPFLTTVIVEDCAATTGVLIAGTGIAVSHVTGNPVYDAVSCCLVGVLMGVSALTLARTNKQFLLGRSVDAALQKKVPKSCIVGFRFIFFLKIGR